MHSFATSASSDISPYTVRINRCGGHDPEENEKAFFSFGERESEREREKERERERRFEA
jgi:hypothetical protein